MHSTQKLFSIGLAIICFWLVSFALLPYSLDLQTHLDHLPYYRQFMESSFSVQSSAMPSNNFIPFLIHIFKLDPESAIYLTYHCAIFLWPVSVFSLSTSPYAVVFLFSTIIPLINLSRQFLAYCAAIIILHTLSKFFRKKYSYNTLFNCSFLAASFLHLAALIPMVINYLCRQRSRLVVLFLPLITLIFLYLTPLLPLPGFLLYSDNASTIQGNFIPSFLILLALSFCLNGRRSFVAELALVSSIALYFILLGRFQQFNQFIYLSRIAWSLIFSESLIYLFHLKFSPYFGDHGNGNRAEMLKYQYLILNKSVACLCLALLGFYWFVTL